MNWKGNIHYFSGGTTGIPKIISYDQQRWECSVQVTSDVLAYHGVKKGSKIAILAPFAPWAIGGVFAEAALQLGAEVYPLGLYGEKEVFSFIFEKVSFSHFVGTAKGIMALHQRIKAKGGSFVREAKTAFVAGEKLHLEYKTHCEREYNTRLVDIYGLAQFDTVAAQFAEEAFALSPTFEYELREKMLFRLPWKEGNKGELFIREKGKEDWLGTGDMVSVAANQNSPWGVCKSILMLGRIDECISLKDGTNIGAPAVYALRKQFPEITQLQIQVAFEGTQHKISLCYTTQKGQCLEAEELIEAFKNSTIDIYDSCMHGIVATISAKHYSPQDFLKTPRGKSPSIIDTTAYETVQ
jgi:phenylacetate-coenzyme A ligase PaaK-like adenylate-forming protein